MAKNTTTQEVTAGPIEFQMRFRDIMRRASEDFVRPERGDIGPYVTVSRQAGSGGAQVASLVADRLGWALLDKELVQELADKLKLQPELLELMDETRSNWFSDMMLNLMNSRLVQQESYVAMAGRVMALTAYNEPVVLVGRGANLLLPRERGLSVRVAAPHPFRVEQMMQREGVDEKAASDRIDELDRGRRDFVRRHFDCDIDHIDLYDLVVDTATFGIDGAAEVITHALEVRGLVGSSTN